MALEFQYDKINRVITVPISETEVSIQQLLNDIRDYEDELYVIDIYHLAEASGKQSLGGGVLVGITLKLIDWKLKFADRPPPTWVTCNVRGGNLVAVEIDATSGEETYVNPIEPSAYVTVSLTASSSATLQEQEAIQFASYQNAIWISPTNGQAGTAYPTGTREYPVNNFNNALEIAASLGLNTLRPLENITCNHDLDGYRIVGENPLLTEITLAVGCSTAGTEFKDVKLTGAFNGAVEIRDCVINTVTGFKGTAYNCSLTGNINLGGTSSDLANFLDCYLGTAYIGLVEIDMGGDGPHLAMRGYSGGVLIKNKSGASKVAIDFLSGRMEIADTVTAGTFYVRGVGEITSNEGTGITLHKAPLTQSIKDETDKISSLPTLVEIEASTVLAKQADLIRALGLMQENYYMDQCTYIEYEGAKLLASARIRIYSDGVSVGTANNVIATYQVTPVWTNDELTSYKAVRQ